MLDVYLTTLALAVGLGLAATAVSYVASRTISHVGLFHRRRGASERPRWGGVAVFVTFAVVPFIVSAFSHHANQLFAPKSGHFVAFLGACTLIFAIGFLDDWKVLDWRPKLVVQIAAASAVYMAGYSIHKLGLPWGPELDLGPIAPLLTVLWVVFCTNAINLIDGRDGVATGVSVLAAATLAQIAASAGHPTVALLLIAAAGAGLGLLPFNLPPASVLLGDSGALLFGFILGALSIRGATGSTDAVFIAVPIVALGFPIADSVLAVLRRALDHRHPLLRDEDHIHHRLEIAGFGPRGLVVVIYAISALFATGALLLHHVRIFGAEAAVLIGVVAVVIVLLTRLGYLLSLWNSASVVWLRQWLRREAVVPVRWSDPVDRD
jgi:UDP-GlcNAc:undecaprenyl-phosphate GlcNAc-1-phosphate transferase